MGEPREIAEVEGEESGGGGRGCPENAGRELALQLRSGGLRLGLRLLVEYEAVVDRETEQNGGETGADDIEGSEPEPAEAERSHQGQREQSHEPEERGQAPVHPEE